jgi:hypothetical protein
VAIIKVGLAVWHKEILSEVDQIARSLREDYYYSFAYPKHFDAVELQLGGPTILSRKLGRQYNPYSFRQDARNARIQAYQAEFHDGKKPDNHRSIEHAVDIILREVRDRPFVSFHSSDGVYDPRQNKVVTSDLSEPNDGLRQLAITQYRNMMTLADALDSDVFVIHPGAYRNWLGDLGHRKHRIDVFYQSFRDLIKTQVARDARFQIAIENLEFDKFPATVDELVNIWWNCANIAEQEGADRNRIKMCLDLQHLRHSLKVINEPANYPRLSHTPNIDDLLKGFSNVHRKLFGISYNWCWKSLHYDPFDIVADFLANNVGNVRIVHTAGNDNSISETHGPVNYHPNNANVPYFALNHRTAVETLMQYGFDGAIIVEDHSPNYYGHINSGESIRRYIGERL